MKRVNREIREGRERKETWKRSPKSDASHICVHRRVSAVPPSSPDFLSAHAPPGAKCVCCPWITCRHHAPIGVQVQRRTDAQEPAEKETRQHDGDEHPRHRDNDSPPPLPPASVRRRFAHAGPSQMQPLDILCPFYRGRGGQGKKPSSKKRNWFRPPQASPAGANPGPSQRRQDRQEEKSEYMSRWANALTLPTPSSTHLPFYPTLILFPFALLASWREASSSRNKGLGTTDEWDGHR